MLHKSLLEKKAAILEKALYYHPSSDLVISLLLDIAMELEEDSNIEYRFNVTLEQFPLSLILW